MAPPAMMETHALVLIYAPAVCVRVRPWIVTMAIPAPLIRVNRVAFACLGHVNAPAVTIATQQHVTQAQVSVLKQHSPMAQAVTMAKAAPS